MTAAFVEVRLRQLPVRIWERAREQSDGLRREFLLISTAPEAGRDLPSRLTALMDDLETRYHDVSSAQELTLFDAAARGALVLDELTYLVPAELSEASQELAAALAEADDYCREGAHLLTLAADPEVARFRAWYLAQFVDQIAGLPPVAWPDWP